MLLPFIRFVPFTCHWYLNGFIPTAATVKVAFDPTATAWFVGVGCIVITGDDATVRTALELVTDPAMFVTTTV